MNVSNWLTRRKFALVISAAMLLTANGAFAENKAPASARQDMTPKAIEVYKAKGCGCCVEWNKILADKGFELSQKDLPFADLAAMKTKLGVPGEMASCHTALINGYVIEGHVPVEDIEKLLAERPDAVGLSVPGMPLGSPGMGPESEREAYDVMLIKKDGSTEVFKHYESMN